MRDVIIVKPEKCTGCNACVRACPASEANITRTLDDNKFITSINSEKCIACGECIKNCKHGARDYLDDTEACMQRIEEEKIIILATPSIKAALPGQWRGVLDWFKKKGCIVYDASLGADICTWAHLKQIEFQKMDKIISQPCAAVVNYIEMYQPKLLKNLSPIHSPIACMATYVKKYQRRTNPIAVLTPCIAKKHEFDETGLVEFNVTFKKLMEYFEKNDIKIQNAEPCEFEYDFEDIQGQLGSVFSRPGGLRDNIWQRNPELNVINSEGIGKVYPELELYGNLPEYKRPDIFDVLSCEYGCNVGPGAALNLSGFDVMATMRGIERDARSKLKTKGGMFRGNTTDDKLFKMFDETLDQNDFIRNYRPMKTSPIPNDKDLVPIFESMGKHTDESRHFDCHACGYKSCRDMAIAIYRGLNTPSNCTIHAKEVLLARHSDLQAHNERLAEMTSQCVELSEKLTHDINEITESMSAIGDSTAKTNERAKVVNDLLKNVVSFCNNNTTMDEGTVQQLIKILETTIKAFSVLDDNVNITNTNSEHINKSIAQIQTLINNLDNTLHKTQDC